MLNVFKSLFGLGSGANKKELIDSGALILDVRTKEEYANGHVKASVNVPLNNLRSYLKKIKSKDQVIITCCASGMRSASAKNILEGEGFTNVHNAGGWTSLRSSL